GMFRFETVLSPSWPFWLPPQAATVPSEQSARKCSKPASNATTRFPKSAEPGALLTATGVKLAPALPVAPLPSWPPEFSDQAATVPSEHNAAPSPDPETT